MVLYNDKIQSSVWSLGLNDSQGKKTELVKMETSLGQYLIQGNANTHQRNINFGHFNSILLRL